MRCSQCETELPDTATSCPRCGHTTSQDTPPAFSYLSPGTPPWPGTPLPKIAYANSASATQQAGILATKAAATSKKKGSPLLVGLVFILLIPLLGAGITLGSLYLQGQFPPHPAPKPNAVSAAPGANDANNVNGANGSNSVGANGSNSVGANGSNGTGATPAQGDMLPTPASYKQTSSPDLNISMQYPSDWIAENPSKSASGTTIYIHPSSQQIPFEVYIRHLSDTVSSQIPNADTLNQQVVSAIGSQFSATNLQNLPPTTTQPTVAGVKWTKTEVTFNAADSNNNSITVHVITISVQHNKSYYNVTFLMNDIVYSEATKKYAEPMLDSIQFLN